MDNNVDSAVYNEKFGLIARFNIDDIVLFQPNIDKILWDYEVQDYISDDTCIQTKVVSIKFCRFKESEEGDYITDCFHVLYDLSLYNESEKIYGQVLKDVPSELVLYAQYKVYDKK